MNSQKRVILAKTLKIKLCVIERQNKRIHIAPDNQRNDAHESKCYIVYDNDNKVINANATSSIHVLFRGDNAYEIEKSYLEKTLLILLFSLSFVSSVLPAIEKCNTKHHSLSLFDLNSHLNQYHISLLLFINQLSRFVRCLECKGFTSKTFLCCFSRLDFVNVNIDNNYDEQYCVQFIK